MTVPSDIPPQRCAECGEDCVPEPSGADGLGIRIMYVCVEHGVQTVVDPFEKWG